MQDPIKSGLAAGWKHVDASTLSRGQTVDADVVVIGTGAGGGVTADILSDAGLRVVLVEEGPLRSSSDFRMREADAYPELYQESASRKTADKGVKRARGGRASKGATPADEKPPVAASADETSAYEQPRPSEAAAPEPGPAPMTSTPSLPAPRLGDRALFPDLQARAYLNHAAISPPSRAVQAALHACIAALARAPAERGAGGRRLVDPSSRRY